jgi:hypothetical protein
MGRIASLLVPPPRREPGRIWARREAERELEAFLAGREYVPPMPPAIYSDRAVELNCDWDAAAQEWVCDDPRGKAG